MSSWSIRILLLASVLTGLSTPARAHWCGYADSVSGQGRSSVAWVRHVDLPRGGLDVSGSTVNALMICRRVPGNCVGRRGVLAGTLTVTSPTSATLDGTLTYAKGNLTCSVSCYLTDEDGEPNRRGMCTYVCPGGPVPQGSFGFSKNCFR